MEPLPGHPRIGILTVSDRASRGDYEDRSGPAVARWFESHFGTAWEAVARIEPDERQRIAAALVEMTEAGCACIVTSGGTGPAPRDVTPEATRDVLDRELPGLGERMRSVSAESVPTAILSRAIAGTRGRTLIVNLPGNPRAIPECLDAIGEALRHCLDMLADRPHEAP